MYFFPTEDCRFDRFTLKYDTTFRAKAVCKHMGEATKSTPEECAVAACYFEGNVFNWAVSVTYAYDINIALLDI